jgi:hypothetical protein
MAAPAQIKVSEDKREAFLEIFAATGNVGEACRTLGIHRSLPWKWRESDPDFAAAWAMAIEEYRDEIRSEVHRRAFGWDEPLHYQGRLTGEMVPAYSDRMLLALATSRLPEMRDRVEVEVTGELSVTDVRERLLDSTSATFDSGHQIQVRQPGDFRGHRDPDDDNETSVSIAPSW